MADGSGSIADNDFFHSDRASQYSSAKIRRWAKIHHIHLSVRNIGVCSVQDSRGTVVIHAETASPFRKRPVCHNALEVRISIGAWIEDYYNCRRVHTITGQAPK